MEKDVQALEDMQDDYDFKRKSLQSRSNIRYIFSISLLHYTIFFSNLCETRVTFDSFWMNTNGMWFIHFIFSVEAEGVQMNGPIPKEIQQEEMAIRQMFIVLGMKREV